MGGIRGIFDDPLLTLIALIALGLLATIAAALAVPRIPVRAVGEIGKLFLGVEVPPALVGWVRALTTAWVSGAIVKLSTWAGIDSDPILLTGLVVSMVGSMWGLLDQAKKKRMNQVPDAPNRPPPLT